MAISVAAERKGVGMMNLNTRVAVNGKFRKVKLGERACFDNFRYIVTDDESENVVGVLENERVYLLGDRVEIRGDIRGYISPSIRKPGFGVIVDIATDYTDHFYGVRMDNGEYGHVKSARIWRNR